MWRLPDDDNPGLPWEWFAAALLIVAFCFALWGFHSRDTSFKPVHPVRVVEPAAMPSAEPPVVAQTPAAETTPSPSSPSGIGRAHGYSRPGNRHRRPPLELAIPRLGLKTRRLSLAVAFPQLRVHSWFRSRLEKTPGWLSAPTGAKSCRLPSTHQQKSPLELETRSSSRRAMPVLSISHSTARSCQPRGRPTKLRPSLLIPAVRSSSLVSASHDGMFDDHGACRSVPQVTVRRRLTPSRC